MYYQTEYLNTADAMFQYCIDNELLDKFENNNSFFEKHIYPSRYTDFEVLENALHSHEKVLFPFQGILNHKSKHKYQGNYAFALTDSRLVMAQKQFSWEYIDSISTDKIEKISYSSGIINGTITISTFNNSITVTGTKKIMKKVYNKLNEFIY